MSQSPELAGGEGFTFEGDAAAFYLTALLDEAYAPGIDDRIVVRVSVQQRDFGEPLDDVIVDFEGATKNTARLSLQVKRSLTVSSAKTNVDFRSVIEDSWKTLKKPDFRLGVDRYGAAVGTITPTKQRALTTLCDWARESLTNNHFFARFANGGNASAEIRSIKDEIVILLNEAKGSPCILDEIHQFFAHFVLIQFDFLREGATDSPVAINHIRNCLVPEDALKAPLVWARMVQVARASAGKAGQFDRARLVRTIASVARIRGVTSFLPDLEKIIELSQSYVNLIADDIGGTRLERSSLLGSLKAKLSTARVVQVRGLPGSGKSVVVRRAVQDALVRGPVLFLKAEQLEGGSWASFASLQGLSGKSLEQLLVEVGAAGTSILFIDAIDRIEKARQPIILDVIRVIVESPLLENWNIVVSLRDTGIGLLRNWLGEYLNILTVDTLEVDQLSDDEAEMLAKSKPHLRPLLFGSAQVRDIVRRPFFAKVMHQSCVAALNSLTFAPRSEVDLIEDWWRQGGYNETGQNAIERQQGLLDLARVHARQLSQPIRLGDLTSLAHIDDLRSDGIIQNAREGISVRFAHDIFFEWAFFYVLADSGNQWLNLIKEYGEPPAIARVVELASQWEYAQGRDWRAYLTQLETCGLRSQWLRAWLVGPLGSACFETSENQFELAVFAGDFRLFRKTLVWFQAEKTTPNAMVLAGELPTEQRQRFADLLGWPSDFAAWRRLINFILQRISGVPQRLYPEIVEIFDVWQNALAEYHNPTSHALLQQCATWLSAIDSYRGTDAPDETRVGWENVPELENFQKSLVRLLLRSSITETTFAADYLLRVTNSKDIQDELFHEIVLYSPVLAKSLPHLLVELSLAFLQDELPDERAVREKQELRREAKWREAVLMKPESERTHQEQLSLSYPVSLRGISDFSYHDWEDLSVNKDRRSFWPPSPLREPFRSLFKSSPEEALRLLRELCRHAMTSWRQLHRYSRDRQGIPLPLELTFPWGTQTFWGGDREYLWCRSTWAPRAIGCGFMALEEWCFVELSRGRCVDELIRQIVEGNECIAILGTAAMLTLHTETLSETTLTLVSSQRLLTADEHRWEQDISSSTANLIGFRSPTDRHFQAVKAANERLVRKTSLKWLVPRFLFTSGPLSDRVRQSILNFRNQLPFQYQGDSNSPEIREALETQALEYSELVEPENYRAVRIEENSPQIKIMHVSPTAAKPENIAKAEQAANFLKYVSLWPWASKIFDEREIQGPYTIGDAIALAKEADSIDLFAHSNDIAEADMLPMRRGAVAATAAIVLNFREGLAEEDLRWARDVLVRAIRLPEKYHRMWFPSSNTPWHHAIFVARGLAAEFREGTATASTVRDLFCLIAHPLEVVSQVAFEEVCQLWPEDPRLAWSALILGFSLCHVPSRSRGQSLQHSESLHSPSEAQTAVEEALRSYKNGSGWSAIPLPPPAWVKATSGKERRGYQEDEDYDEDDEVDPPACWIEPKVWWHSQQAAKILGHVPPSLTAF